MTPVQHGILFHSLSHQGSEVYVSQIAGRLCDNVNLDAFADAWRRVVRRHGMLRTALEWQQQGEPTQREAADVPFSFEFGDWPAVCVDHARALLNDFLARDRARGLDLRRAPLMRVSIIRSGGEPCWFVWTSHHSIVDGRARIVVLREVAQLYQALCRGAGEPDLPPAPPYRDFVDWFVNQDLGPAEAYWRKCLEGLSERTPLQLPRRRTAPAAGFGSHAVLCSREVRAQVAACAEASRTTVNTIVQAAWAVLLARYTGQDDVVFGATRACRRIPVAGAADMVGVLINTVPVRVRLDSVVSTWDVLEQLRAQNLAVRPYEQTPLLRIQEWSGLSAGASLFDTVTVFENADVNTTLRTQAPGLPIADVTRHGFTHYPLTLFGSGSPELSLRLDFDRSIHDDDAMARMAGHFAELLGSMVSSLDTPPSRLPLLRPQERHQLLVEWNGAPAGGGDASLVDRFEAQARWTPDAVAVSCRGESVSYRTLNTEANRLAHYLRRRGVGVEQTVGVCLARSPQLVGALLGIMKAGGAYVPLDPKYPSERIGFMTRDARTRVVLTDRTIPPELAGSIVERIDLDDDEVRRAIQAEPDDDPPGIHRPDTLAYVIYTSGSTGTPKGVAIEHRNTAAFLDWAVRHFRDDLGAVLAGTSICFDLSVFELFAPLMIGGAVVLVDNVLALLRDVPWPPVTLVNAVPSAIDELLRHTTLPASVRTVCLAGEPLPASLVRRIYGQDTIQRVVNLYGPSETTTYSTFAVVPRGSDDPPPIGRPIDNTCVYVLDRHRELVPAGVAGELYIGGAGVARGYLFRPELTEERFVPDPFAADRIGRCYRTGDLVRHLPDGNLDFLGRTDHQVKIRGFRIEPGEIEAALRQHPAVQQAVVAVEDGAGGDKELIAYVRLRERDPVSDDALVAFLRHSLPAHMIPRLVLPVEKMPLTPNGKIDRAALRQIRGSGPRRPAHVPPRKPLEVLVAAALADTLGVAGVGLHDDFVALGGHSLTAMRLVSMLSDSLQIDLPLNAPFTAPTVAELVRLVETHEHVPGHAARIARGFVGVPGTRSLPS